MALLCIVVAAACIFAASPTGQGADEEYLELERRYLHMPRAPSTSRLSRVRTTLKQLDDRLSHSGWLLADARYSFKLSVLRLVGQSSDWFGVSRGRRTRSPPKLAQMSSAISREASKFAEEVVAVLFARRVWQGCKPCFGLAFMRCRSNKDMWQERRQQHNYDAVVAREEAQNEVSKCSSADMFCRYSLLAFPLL